MRWRDAKDELEGQFLLHVLTTRPYLTADEILQRCHQFGVRITPQDLDSLLYDEEAPFYPEPVRWFATPQDDEYLDDEEDDEVDEPDEDDDAQVPSRWIGPELRKWQMEAFDAWVNAGEHGIVEAITGTGKTVVAAYAAAYVLDYGYKVAVTVPTLDLMDQWISQLETCIEGVAVGRLGDGYRDSLDEVEILVSTIASGSRKYMRADGADTLLIADEVHRMGSDSYRLALEDEMVARLGLTATLERTNDSGVEDVLIPYFGSVVYSYGYSDGLHDEVLAPFRLGFIAAEFTDEEEAEFRQLGSEMSGLKRQLEQAGFIQGDGPEIFAAIGALSKQEGLDFNARRWAQRFMTNLSRRRRLQASAENKLLAVRALAPSIAMSERALVFTETKDAAATIAEELRDDSIEAWPFDSTLNRQERTETLDLFRNGDIQVLCAPRVLDEGVDVPDVDVGVIVSASQSRRQMIQRLGRLVRPNQHGDPSTLFLIYLKGTREDPDEGGYEGFLDEVLPHAVDMAFFEADDDPDTIAEWASR